MGSLRAVYVLAILLVGGGVGWTLHPGLGCAAAGLMLWRSLHQDERA